LKKIRPQAAAIDVKPVSRNPLKEK